MHSGEKLHSAVYQLNSVLAGEPESVLTTVEKSCTVYQLTSSVLAGEVGSVVLTVFDIGWGGSAIG